LTICFHFFRIAFVITMSSEAATKIATDQTAADKRAADEAAAAATSEATATAALANWPTGGYYMLIPLLLISLCIVLAISVDVSTICLVLHSYVIKYQYVHLMLMFYSWINIIEKLPRFLTIQKPNLCRQFLIQGFVAALKPAPFTWMYFKHWQTKTILWLTAMNVFWVASVTLTGTIAPEQEKAFREATFVFVGAFLSMIRDKLVDAYLHVRVAKDLWEALESKLGATDAGSEMYIIEQFD
jgi:hypothetical protein